MGKPGLGKYEESEAGEWLHNRVITDAVLNKDGSPELASRKGLTDEKNHSFERNSHVLWLHSRSVRAGAR